MQVFYDVDLKVQFRYADADQGNQETAFYGSVNG
jgi:hypothetical protein